MVKFFFHNSILRRCVKKIADLSTPLPNNCRPISDNDRKWRNKNFWLRLAGINISRKGVAIEYGFRCLTSLERNIHIDDYTLIGIGANFWNFNEIRIGKFCLIAADVTFTNGGHDRNSLVPFSGPLLIRNGTWIGNGARIIGPITIGENAIIAAGSVVICDVPAGSIVAGVPAKIIGKRELPEKVWYWKNAYFCPYTFKKMEDDS